MVRYHAMRVLEFLMSRAPLFEGLAEGVALRLAAAAEPRPVAAGQTVVFRGTTLDGIYAIVSGAVGVWVKTKKGVVEAARLGEGEVFGETSLLEQGTAGATIKACEGGAQLLWIPQEAFYEALSSSPELRARAEIMMAERKERNASALGPGLVGETVESG